MTIKRTPRPRDPIQLGKLMLDIVTGAVPDGVDDGKDARAAESGSKGGSSRSASLSADRRAEIARKAASSRWQKGQSAQTKKEPA